MVCAEATVREVYRIVTGETNGYSLDVATGLAFLDELRRDVEPLRADASTHERWREILVRNNVLGRRVHDAHIAATLLSHGVTTVVTLDAKFRFTGLDARTPAELLAALGAVRQEDRERDPDQ